LGHEMDAVITGVEEFGLFAQGIELPAEGFIHVTTLEDDYYRFERASHSLTGRSGRRYRLGDFVRVRVVRVDIDRRELDFRIVRRKKQPERAAKPGRMERKKKGRRKGKKKAAAVRKRGKRR